jgi:hypothetical protein
MSTLISLGKNELKDLGLRFVVVNVPVFATVAHQSNIYRMDTIRFKTLEEVKSFFQKGGPYAVFDQTGVYKEKANRVINEPTDMYGVRCCKVTLNDLENVRKNLKETHDIIYSYVWDFSCWDSKLAAT